MTPQWFHGQHVFLFGFQAYLLDVSSLSLFKCTEPTQVKPQLSAPTCWVIKSSVCLLFGKYECTHILYDVTDMSIHVAKQTPLPLPHNANIT